MKGLKILFIIPLLIGCAMEVSSENDKGVNDSYEYPTDHYWDNDNSSVPLCRPYYYEVIFNGEIIEVYEPALCPLGPSFDKINIDPVDEFIDLFDEQFNPVENVLPFDERVFTPEKEVIR